MPSSSFWPAKRLQIISSHLQPSHPPAATMAAPAQKDPITCHVLDTTTGRPAAGIKVALVPSRLDWDWEPEFYATTDTDGRVLNWKATFPDDQEKLAGGEIKRLITKISPSGEANLAAGEARRWKLRFETGAYYGEDKTFFPIVELTFLVKAGEEHYHVSFASCLLVQKSLTFCRYLCCLGHTVSPRIEGVRFRGNVIDNHGYSIFDAQFPDLRF